MIPGVLLLLLDMLPRFGFAVKVILLLFEDYVFCIDQPKLGENNESKKAEVQGIKEKEKEIIN